jgi:hypothetical protein
MHDDDDVISRLERMPGPFEREAMRRQRPAQPRVATPEECYLGDLAMGRRPKVPSASMRLPDTTE